MLKFFIRITACIAITGLAACGSPRGRLVSAERGTAFAGLECAPFARELSGIALYGDAATWWDGAAGLYARSSTPVVGSVLVFRRSNRLPSGHVSVVSGVLGPRQVDVFQANWVRGELDEDQLIVDVSAANDWSAVRVWYPPVNQLGANTYETFGFVTPPRQTTHEQLARASRNAALIAISSRVGRPVPRARNYGF